MIPIDVMAMKANSTGRKRYASGPCVLQLNKEGSQVQLFNR